jgi:hypothetical protein
VFPTGETDDVVVFSGMIGNVEVVRWVPLRLRECDILYCSFATVAVSVREIVGELAICRGWKSVFCQIENCGECFIFN